MRLVIVGCWRRLLTSEEGIALPVALLVTVIGLSLATVPIIASVNTQSGDRRDQVSDAALAAADAGANVAISRQNLMAPYLTSSKPCVKLNGSRLEAVAATSGWCPTQTLTSASNPPAPVGTKVEYRIKPAYSTSGGNNAITVYAVGSAETGGRTVTRQIAMEASSTPGAPSKSRFLGSEAIVGEESLTFSGGGNASYGSVGTNGKFTFTGGSNKICGSLRYGVGYEAPHTGPYPIGSDPTVPVDERPYREKEHNGICYPPQPPTSQVYAGNVTYPSPEAPDDIAMNNSNGRFFSEDGRDLPSWYLQNPTNSWNPSTRTLSIDSGVDLTLSGTKPYFLCRLRLEGGATITTQAPGQPVSIFFDRPENCGNLPNVTLAANGKTAKQQLIIAGGSEFLNNGYLPGLYFLGSTNGTRSQARVEIQNFNGVIYGPNTDFESINGGLRFSGAIVARTVVLTGGSRVQSSFNGENYEIPVKGDPTPPGAFARARYIECAGATLGSGC